MGSRVETVVSAVGCCAVTKAPSVTVEAPRPNRRTNTPTSVSQTLAPEAAQNRVYPLQRQIQIDWSSPINNRILLEGGVNRYRAASNLAFMEGLSPAMINTTEQSTGLVFRALDSNRLAPTYSLHKRFTASYITGAHAVKVGVSHTDGWNQFTNESLNPLSYRLNNAIPNQLSQRAFPINTQTDMEHNLGIFAQDKWTVDRLTAAYGVRYSYVSVGWPEQHLGPSVLTPTRNLTFPAVNGNLTWHDLKPNLGHVYDVFETGSARLGSCDQATAATHGIVYSAWRRSASQPMRPA